MFKLLPRNWTLKVVNSPVVTGVGFGNFWEVPSSEGLADQYPKRAPIVPSFAREQAADVKSGLTLGER